MDGFGSDRRTEIVVSGGKNSSQIYATHQSPAPSSKPWRRRGFTEREMKRKKRIARYNVYSVEGKVKASIKASLRWIKNKCSQIVHASC